MTFSKNHGRCIGRLLQFLYRYNIDFDYCQIGDGEVLLHGRLVAKYVWDGDTDIPTFVFYERFEYLNKVQNEWKQQILEGEKNDTRRQSGHDQGVC